MTSEALVDRKRNVGEADPTVRRSSSTELRVDSLHKSYGGTFALDNLSLRVAPGIFQAILGPSGSGKTSLLMCVAGFLTPDSGRIFVNDRDVLPLPPEKRNFGMVFQGYALFPHLSVLDNVAFGLRARGVVKHEKIKRAKDAIRLVRLSGMEQRYPRQLSGGQQQRVALARAIAIEPDLLLLDEPLSALDRALRSELQTELKDLQRKTGLTCLYVTHDQDEALSMADVVAVMTAGQIKQIGAPVELYERPTSRFVASFLGKSNFLQLEMVEPTSSGAVGRCRGVLVAHSGPAPAGPTLLLALRPEKIAISGPGETQLPGRNYVAARVLHASYLGNAVELVADARGLGELTVRARPSAVDLASQGRAVELSWPVDATVAIPPDGRSEAR
jgi:putative spermidine/putrescine transport system ATP-binding protein